MHNAKYLATERAIEAALLACLKREDASSITVSDLAREAKISRNTFYSHYGNVMDAYAALALRTDLQTKNFQERFACQECIKGEGKQEFCKLVRSNAEAGTVARDGAYLDYLLQSEDTPGYKLHLRELEAAGIPEALARAIWLFQVGGCYTAATRMDCPEEEWERCKALIDRFINAGMESIGVRVSDSKR